MYPPELVAPMKEDLTGAGFTELLDAGQVDDAINGNAGTTFVVINSVCGCAAANARPAAKMAIQNGKKPVPELNALAALVETSDPNRSSDSV